MSRVLKMSTSSIEEAVAEDPKLARALSKLRQLDKDNNNELSLSEVAACVQELADSEKERNMLRKLVIAMTVLMLLFAAAIVGLTYAIVDLSKDTKVSNGVLQPKDGSSDSVISTGAARTMHDDAASVLLSLTSTNASSLHSLMIPCNTCAGEGSVDVYSVEHVRLHAPGQLVAVYTGAGEVIVADAEVSGLQVFNNITVAAAYLNDASDENASGGTRRRRLLQTTVNGGAITDSSSISTTPVTDTGLSISSASGYKIIWNGNIGDNYGKPVPLNLALASEGGTAIGNGSPSTTINDGVFGNANSWFAYSTKPWIGVSWAGINSTMLITSIAFGRDNMGEFNDRCVGEYYIQVTQHPAPSGSLTDGVTDPTKGWLNVGTISIKSAYSAFKGPRRHAYNLQKLVSGKVEPIKATGIRIKPIKNSSNQLKEAPFTVMELAIDELEIYGQRFVNPSPPPPASPPPPPFVFLNREWSSVASSSNGTKLIAAGGVNDIEYIYTSSDSGVTWTKRESAGAALWRAVASSSDGVKLCAASSESIYTSVDSGVTWVQSQTGLSSWRAIASSGDGTKLAAGVRRSVQEDASTGGYIYTSNDGGASWTPSLNDTIRSWEIIVSPSIDGNVLIAGAEYFDGVWTSNDGGAEWKQKVAGGVWAGAASSSNGTKLVLGRRNGYVDTSSDNGATWRTSLSVTGYWYAVASSSDGVKLAAATENGYIYTSTNSGVNWTKRTGPGARPWKALASSADGTKLVAAATGGNIYTSSDSGVTWVKRF